MKTVIIGGGPAGLITGLRLLEKENETLILEKKPKIASTACAEGCDIKSLKKIPFDSSSYISKKIKGFKLVFPDGKWLLCNTDGVVLDRNRWLKGMADEFKKRGGTLKTNANVKSIKESNLILQNGEQIKYDRLIGADGPYSIIGKNMGINQKHPCGVQYKIKYDTSNMDYLELYLDKKFSEHYSWVFPKDNVINVGLLGKFSQLDSFLDYLKIEKNIVSKEGGAIPLCGISKKIVEENKALIGDAASMTNPLSGGGITPIIHASSILAKNIYDFKNYEKEVQNHPMFHKDILKATNVLLKTDNNDLEKIGKIFHGKVLGEMTNLDFLRISKYPLIAPKISAIGKGLGISLKWGW
ncbi:MAG: NAD(P)/FAD-dependent oxidoreductase [Thermoplasmatales archaeon]|nr:MAG: NAD(P)/FAD-dependent oxidoreductase [Thermoplasmatales archaeon]